MTFYRGQKVVFVGFPSKGLIKDAIHGWQRFWHPYSDPIANEVYTIANTYTHCDGDLMLELIEFADGDPEYWAPGWRASGFRPAVDRKSDVSFTLGADPESERWDNRRKIKVRP